VEDYQAWILPSSPTPSREAPATYDVDADHVKVWQTVSKHGTG
jgi:hypothetical protein